MSRARNDDPERSTFPYWVALGCLGAALWLFFANTVPALRERDRLRNAGAELHSLRARYEQALAHLQPGLPQDQDLQSLLVAIDRLGWTPEELLRHHPGPRDTAEDGAGRPQRR